MTALIRRNVVMIAGFALVAWFLISICAPAVRSVRGEFGPLVSLAQSPTSAVLWLGIGLLVALIMALLVGRLTSTNRAMFTLGIALAALAMRFGNSRELCFAEGSLWMAAIEALVWSAVAIGLTTVVVRVCGPIREDGIDLQDSRFFSTGTLKCAAGAIVTIPVVWVLARHDLKGQAIGAVVIGSAVGALVGRIVSPKSQPILLYAAPTFFGACAMAVAAARQSGPLPDAPALGTLSRLAYPMPIDWFASSVVGASIGIAWARSFIHQSGPKASGKA